MGSKAADFLAGLFEGKPPATPAPGPEPPADPEAVAGRKPGWFDGWVLRPDVAGRMGWEAPDLPEADRWWARWTWEQLAKPPLYSE